jgi:hypothetical protein
VPPITCTNQPCLHPAATGQGNGPPSTSRGTGTLTKEVVALAIFLWLCVVTLSCFSKQKIEENYLIFFFSSQPGIKQGSCFEE